MHGEQKQCQLGRREPGLGQELQVDSPLVHKDLRAAMKAAMKDGPWPMPLGPEGRTFQDRRQRWRTLENSNARAR
jgi:hypothetical protein